MLVCPPLTVVSSLKQFQIHRSADTEKLDLFNYVIARGCPAITDARLGLNRDEIKFPAVRKPEALSNLCLAHTTIMLDMN